MPRPFPLLLLLMLGGCATTPGGGNIYMPSGEGRHPAVIVLHSSGGLSSHEERYAYTLSRHGYVALTADYLSSNGPDNIDFAYDFLTSDPKVDPGRIGIVGFSKGAYEAIRFSQHSHDFTDRRVKAIVSYYIGPNVPIGPENEHPAMLFLHGDLDVHTSPNEIHYFCKGVSEENIVCDVQIYEGVRHAFDKKSTYGGYDWKAAADANERALAFLDAHLKMTTAQ